MNLNNMKNLKTYKLFVETVAVKESPPAKEVKPMDNIMKDMADNDEIDPNKIQSTQKNIEDIKEKMTKKKEELEIKLKNLETLEVDTFTEENKKIVDQKREQIVKAIEDIKKDIEGYETTNKTFKENIDKLKK
jgi:chromosome segregation ATPase